MPHEAHGRLRVFVFSVVMLLISVGLTVLGPVSAAQADDGGYPYATYAGPGTNVSRLIWTDANGQSYSTRYRFAYRNCTDYVAWKLDSVNGWYVGVSMGHAKDWKTWARTPPRNYRVDTTPATGAVAWWGAHEWNGNYGHVAYVLSVTSDGKVNLGEYNYNLDGTYSTRTIPKENVDAYIHFADIAPSPTSGVGTRLLGDVNGDNRDDAVVMFRDTGTAMVALSTGNSFAQPVSWANLHTVRADKYFLADVNGDNMADLIAFWQSNGRWRVSLSSGTGFWPETEWAMGHGVGTTRQWVAKVNNDSMADVITYDAATGDWYVSASSGSGFWPPVPWIRGHGIGSVSQEVADFSGDGKVDAGVWFPSGSWYVAISNGGNFNGYTQWSAGHGLNSDKRVVGDANGDNMADPAYFFSGNGHWDIGTSSGTGFWAPTAWAHGHGANTTEQFLAKVNPDNMADIVTFDRITGDWWVSTSSGSGFWPPSRWVSGHGAGS